MSVASDSTVTPALGAIVGEDARARGARGLCLLGELVAQVDVELGVEGRVGEPGRDEPMVGRLAQQWHVDEELFAACRRSVGPAGERDAAPVAVRAAGEDEAATVVRLDAGDRLPVALDIAEAEPIQEVGGRRVRELERLVLRAPARRRVVGLERVDGVEPQLGGAAGVAADGVRPRDLCPVGRVVGAEADRVAVRLGAEHVERAGQAQHRHSYILRLPG